MDSLLAIYPTARKVNEILKQQSRLVCRLGHRVLTFPQLIDSLYRDCPDRTQVLTPIAERLALEEALLRTPREVRDLFPPGPGVIDHLLGLIREFKAAAVQVEDLRHACRALERAAAERVSALGEIFSQYEEILAKRRVADRHDRERRVLSILQRAESGGRRPRMLDGVDRLLVAEIYDFTSLQFRIVTSLIRLIGDATLTIQAEPHRIDSFRFPDLTWNRFVEDESIADQTLPLFVRRDGRAGQLGFVLRHLFQDDAHEPPPPFDETIEIFEAPDRYREVEEIARTIRRALERPSGERVEPGRVALVARDLTPYAKYLESIFRRYQIPLNIHHARAPLASPVAAFILDTIRIPLAGYRRQELERLMSSSLISTAASGYRRLLRNCGYIDRMTRPLAGCLEDYRTSQKSEAASSEGETGRDAAPTRSRSGEEKLLALVGILGRLEREGTVAEHVERLGDVLERLKFEPPVSIASDPGARTSSQAWNAIAELAEAGRMIGSDRVLSPQEFFDLARDVLAEPRSEPAAFDAEAVQAFPALDARGLDFDLVFLLGLEDGGFPHYQSEDPLLSDQARIALNRPLAARLQSTMGGAPSALRKILRTTNERNSEDRFLFFLALSMAERKIVLSYPRADNRGNPIIQSPFVAEVMRLLGHPKRPVLRRSDEGGIVAALDNCFEQSSFLNWCAAQSMLDLPEATLIADSARVKSIAHRIEVERRRERYLALPTREQASCAASSAERLEFVDRYSGRVQSSPRLRDFLIGPPASPVPWSASRLDELGACGFKFFASRVLKLDQEENPDYEPSPLELGRLVHEFLHEFFLQQHDFKELNRVLVQARALLANFRTRQTSAMVRDAALFNLTWQNVERAVEEMVEFAYEEAREERFNRPPLLEQDFNFTLRDSRNNAGETVNLALHGRFDRLDYNRDSRNLIDRIRVRDYKTSRSAKTYAELLKSEAFGIVAFQLPIYLMAALERFRGELAPNVKLEAGYLVLRNRDKSQEEAVPRARVETDPQSRAASARQGNPSLADEIIRLAHSAIRGEFDVDPRKCDDYCAYRRLCRYQKGIPSR